MKGGKGIVFLFLFWIAYKNTAYGPYSQSIFIYSDSYLPCAAVLSRNSILFSHALNIYWSLGLSLRSFLCVAYIPFIPFYLHFLFCIWFISFVIAFIYLLFIGFRFHSIWSCGKINNGYLFYFSLRYYILHSISFGSRFS